MVWLDGKKLSQKILGELKAELVGFKKKLRLAVVVVGEDPVVKKFIAQKRTAAESIGMQARLYPFAVEITTNELRKRLSEIVHEDKNSGVIVQLPLPSHLNASYILNAVTPQKDVDVLSARAVGNFAIGKSPVLPPVVGAVEALLTQYHIAYQDQYTVVMGAGQLVGKPLALWLLNQKATFSVVRRSTPNPEEFLKRADLIISGTGCPRSIRADMVKDGVAIIDAGTSESEGKLVGDVDADSVSGKAAYLTPVPGGVGPLTVAMVLKNLFTLAQRTK